MQPFVGKMAASSSNYDLQGPLSGGPAIPTLSLWSHLPLVVGGNATHVVVHGGKDGDGLLGDVHAGEDHGGL